MTTTSWLQINPNYSKGGSQMEMAMQTMQARHKKEWLLRNEKGLTLIELLAVLVIIAIIAAIAIPSVSSIIAKSKDNTHRANAQLIVDASRNMVLVGGLETSAEATGSVNLKTLYEDGYLETMPKDPQGDGSYDSEKTVVNWSTNDKQKTTYTITLASSDGTKNYFTNVSEDQIKKAAIGSTTP